MPVYSAYKQVSEDEFYDFVDSYPNDLTTDIARIGEPPTKIYYDSFEKEGAAAWVAHIKLFRGDEYDGGRDVEFYIPDERRSKKEEAKKQLLALLKGIDKGLCEEEGAWWETSRGADFGAEKLKGILDIVDKIHANDVKEPCHGFAGTTLRDYFAGQAINAILTDIVGGTVPVDTNIGEVVAEGAYEIADAMLLWRGK